MISRRLYNSARVWIFTRAQGSLCGSTRQMAGTIHSTSKWRLTQHSVIRRSLCTHHRQALIASLHRARGLYCGAQTRRLGLRELDPLSPLDLDPRAARRPPALKSTLQLLRGRLRKECALQSLVAQARDLARAGYAEADSASAKQDLQVRICRCHSIVWGFVYARISVQPHRSGTGCEEFMLRDHSLAPREA